MEYMFMELAVSSGKTLLDYRRRPSYNDWLLQLYVLI